MSALPSPLPRIPECTGDGTQTGRWTRSQEGDHKALIGWLACGVGCVHLDAVRVVRDPHRPGHARPAVEAHRGLTELRGKDTRGPCDLDDAGRDTRHRERA